MTDTNAKTVAPVVFGAIRNVLPLEKREIAFSGADSLLNDLGLDSLGLANLALELEDALGIGVDDIAGGMEGARTVQDVLDRMVHLQKQVN